MPFDVKGTIAARLGARQGNANFIDFRSLMDVIADVLQDGRVTQADFPVVAEYAEELFETHVRPYDIPGVPPIAEGFVDDMLKGLIRPAIQALFERFVDGGGGPNVSV